jgi:hypothetical protein
MQASDEVGKTCRKCSIRKPLSEFYAKPEAKDGRKSPCKECCRQTQKAWKQRNGPAVRRLACSYRKRNRSKLRERHAERAKVHGVEMAEYRRRWNLAKRYGITVERFFEILEKQGGKCGICGKTLGKKDRNAVVDHCHGTGVVRGILCVRCNVALGAFGDSCEGLAKAMLYLERSKNEQ